MAVSTGKHCGNCGVSIPIGDSSGLCFTCYADQTMNTRRPPQSGSGVPQKPLHRVCKECHHPFTIVRSKDLCHPCYNRDQEKEQLKLFEVSVWENGNSGRPSSTTVILDVDEDGAALNVLEKMDCLNVSKTEVTELVGPYAPGFIVSFSTLE